MKNQNSSYKILRGDLKIVFTAEKESVGRCCLERTVSEPGLKKQADLFTQGTGQEGATGLSAPVCSCLPRGKGAGKKWPPSSAQGGFSSPDYDPL